MKKTLFIIIGLFVLLQSGCRLEELFAEEVFVCGAEFTSFERFYTPEDNTLSVGDMVSTSDGAFVICGGIDDDIFLLKVDQAGETVFFKRDVISGSDENCNSIATTPDGGFVICGKQESRAYTAKYDAQGEHLNQDTQPQISNCRCIAPADNGQYIISGSIRHNNNQINTYVAPVVFNNTFPDIQDGYLPVPPRDSLERAQAVIATSGGYAVVGFSYNSIPLENGTAAHFYRLDNQFNLISEGFYHIGTQQDVANAIVETPQGNYMITGSFHTTSDVGTGIDIFVIEVNQSGDILHQYSYGGNRGDTALDIIHAHQSGEYILVGYSESFGDSSRDIYVSKIKQNGDLVWEKTFGQSGVDEAATAVLPTQDCGYIIAAQSIQNGLSRPYVIKINESGNIQ